MSDELAKAAKELNLRTNQYRTILKVSGSPLPQNEYLTKADGKKREPKILKAHPTKKVHRSNKQQKFDKLAKEYKARYEKAQERFNKLYEKYGKDSERQERGDSLWKHLRSGQSRVSDQGTA